MHNKNVTPLPVAILIIFHYERPQNDFEAQGEASSKRE